MTTSSAPGKIILFGEHAVVYGRPALAVPVMQVQAEVQVLDSSRPGVWIEAPDVNLHAELNTLPSNHPIAAVIHNLFFLFPPPYPSSTGRGGRGEGFPNLEIKITSTIPVASGLGSGTAVTVALTRALASHLQISFSTEEVNAFAYEIEKIHHGTPSGIDNTVVTYARPAYFVKGQAVEIFKVGAPFTLVIGDTGLSAPTRESVADVRKLWEADQKRWERVFGEVGEVSFLARRVIEQGWINMLGELMDENHMLLKEMTVSSPDLDRLVDAARQAGALGAKLSGGGRGGNMIALVEPGTAETVSLALKQAGATNTIVTQVS
jgi:mevalonate kinase